MSTYNPESHTFNPAGQLVMIDGKRRHRADLFEVEGKLVYKPGHRQYCPKCGARCNDNHTPPCDCINTLVK